MDKHLYTIICSVSVTYELYNVQLSVRFQFISLKLYKKISNLFKLFIRRRLDLTEWRRNYTYTESVSSTKKQQLNNTKAQSVMLLYMCSV